jgi:hypothetical protein
VTARRASTAEEASWGRPGGLVHWGPARLGAVRRQSPAPGGRLRARRRCGPPGSTRGSGLRPAATTPP